MEGDVAMEKLYLENEDRKQRYPNTWIVERECNDHISTCDITRRKATWHSHNITTSWVNEIRRCEDALIKASLSGCKNIELMPMQMHLKISLSIEVLLDE
jgi:hypothetical protein